MKLRKRDNEDDKNERAQSQQAAMAADTERIRVILAHAPANATHSFLATAVIRYGKFWHWNGWQGNGEWWRTKSTADDDRNGHQNRLSWDACHRKRSMLRYAVPLSQPCPPVFVFGSMSNEHLNRAKESVWVWQWNNASIPSSKQLSSTVINANMCHHYSGTTESEHPVMSQKASSHLAPENGYQNMPIANSEGGG